MEEMTPEEAAESKAILEDIDLMIETLEGLKPKLKSETLKAGFESDLKPILLGMKMMQASIQVLLDN